MTTIFFTPEGVREPRKRGRPKADEPGATVCTWLPATQHDRLIQLANKHEMSVSELVRQSLARQLFSGK